VNLLVRESGTLLDFLDGAGRLAFEQVVALPALGNVRRANGS